LTPRNERWTSSKDRIGPLMRATACAACNA
jgi:hypothetical protein